MPVAAKRRSRKIFSGNITFGRAEIEPPDMMSVRELFAANTRETMKTLRPIPKATKQRAASAAPDDEIEPLPRATETPAELMLRRDQERAADPDFPHHLKILRNRMFRRDF